jgi:hypothetical protein
MGSQLRWLMAASSTSACLYKENDNESDSEILQSLIHFEPAFKRVCISSAPDLKLAITISVLPGLPKNHLAHASHRANNRCIELPSPEAPNHPAAEAVSWGMEEKEEIPQRLFGGCPVLTFFSLLCSCLRDTQSVRKVRKRVRAKMDGHSVLDTTRSPQVCELVSAVVSHTLSR